MGRGKAAADRTSGPMPDPWICFAAQDWWYHNRAHSDFQLMTRLARTRPVLLVNSIGLRMPTPGRSTMVTRKLIRKVRSMAKLVRRPLPGVPGFVVMTPFVIPIYQNPLIRALNAMVVRAQVRAVAAVLRIRRPIVLVTIPTASDVVEPMTTGGLIFNRSDRLSEYPEGDRTTIAALEDDLLRQSDRVLYVSHALMATDSTVVGDRAVFIDHGVDLDHFRCRPEPEQPAELRSIPRPRIGFFGGIDDYVVDIDLLERLAAEIPEAHLILVGDASCPMDRFDRYPNVHRLGFRPYDEIPGLGSGFDVAIMPWVHNDWIRMCNPIKLKEYLALGLPVVTTYYPEVEAYRDVVRIARSAEEFVSVVRQTLSDGGPADPERRRAAVLDASWDRIAARLIEIGDEVTSGEPC
ncbi:MAG: glycosyltransferase [Pseudonocardiaceae bacterium]